MTRQLACEDEDNEQEHFDVGQGVTGVGRPMEEKMEEYLGGCEEND